MPINPNLFPVLDNGMLAQLPVTLSIEKLIRGTRFVDGAILAAASESRLQYHWILRYENLSSAEWQRIKNFIEAHKRGSGSFVFPDPCANLLAQSGNLESAVWLTPPGLTVDPFEDAEQPKAFILTNSTPQPLTLTQSVDLAGGFRTCFSLKAKWENSADFGLSISGGTDSNSKQATASSWAIHSVDLTAAALAESRTVGITIPPTTQIVVCCPQLEIAAAPGAYLETGDLGGIFPAAWLAQRSFDSQSNAPGAHSITLHIESLRAL